MSEARTPEEDTIRSRDPREAPALKDQEDYSGPDPEEDPKGDRSDEDQGT